MGCLYPRDEVDVIRQNSLKGIQNAADILQWDYIEGLEANIGHPVSILTRMSLGVYPTRYKKPWIKGHHFQHCHESDDYAVGFFNAIPVRPFFFHKIGMHKAKEWVCHNTANEKIFMAYSYAMVSVLQAVKKANPRVKTVLILLDLPMYTDMAHAQSGIYRIKHWLEERRLRRALNYIDLIVPITKQMRDAIDPSHQVKSLVIDGMVKQRAAISRGKNSAFTISYTGTLTKNYGILDMVEAIKQSTNPNLRVIICGAGETEAEVRAAAQRDNRIDYRGMVSADEAYRIQCASDLLINPRKNEGEYTKYSFPSKILQYMSSGTPVLCYRLDGMGTEYDDYLFYVGIDEPLKDAIERVSAMDEHELREFGAKAAAFVNSEKNNAVQTKRILKELEVL